MAAPLIVLTAACAHAQPDPGTRPARVIEVTGHGRVEVSPDQATVRVGVEILRAETTEAAREAAAQAMQAMQSALEASGVPKRRFRTTTLRIEPDYDFSDRQRKLLGYTARHDLEVDVRELDRLSRVVDATLRAGGDAVRFRGIAFGLVDRETAEAEARALAVAAASRRARELARAAGSKLGDVLLIREGADDSRPPPRPMMRAAEATATPVAPGEIAVIVDVFTRWSIAE